MNIKETIKEQKDKLDTNTDSTIRVGNAMHYPMLIMMNGENADLAYNVINKSFKMMWPTSYEQIIFVKDIIGQNTTYQNIGESVSDISYEDIIQMCERQRSIKNIDMFRSLDRLCFYNIIDTSQLSSFDEFIKYYQSIEQIKNREMGITILSLAIILLDESAINRTVSKQIREYLHDNNKYDGCIVLSTKTKSNYMLETIDLFETVASIIILSNNDALSNADDESYRERIQTIYTNSNNILTVAHSIQKRPTQYILIQVANKIIDCANAYNSRNSNNVSDDDIKKVLGINSSGYIESFENKLNNLSFNLDSNDILYMPYKNIPTNEINTSQTTYENFQKVIFDGFFDEYIESKFNEDFKNQKDLLNELSSYENTIKNSFTATQCKSIEFKKAVDSALGFCNVGSVNKSLYLNDYYKNALKVKARKNLLIPFLKRIFNDMINDASNTIEEFKKFSQEVSDLVPSNNSYNNLGNYYEGITSTYVGTIQGEEELKKLLASGNKNEDFVNATKKIIESIIINNENIFSLTFIDEWMKRMGQVQQTVLNLVQSTFNTELNAKLFFHTTATSPQELLTVYMFHVGDENWNNETPLFQGIKANIPQSQNIQFVNAGYDYKVEALKFFDITGGLLFE